MVSLYLPDPLSSHVTAGRRPLSQTNAKPLDDAELVLAARAGDKSAEEQLYRRHVHYVQGLLLRLLGSRSDAEDAVQETFVIALDQLSGLREPAAFRSWLAQIAVSQARRRFRRARLLRALGLLRSGEEAGLETLAAPHAFPATQAEAATVVQLVARLASDDRIAWSLRYLQGESLDEVADHCRCSLATAKRRISAANAFIRAELGEREGGAR